MRSHLTAVLLCASAGWAAAQGTPIYRCGDSYSQQPCAGGSLIAASDSRSAAQKSQTDAATQRDAKAAAAMEKARMQEEAKPAPVGMPLPAPVPAPKDGKTSKSKPGKKKPDHFTATAPPKPGDEAGKKKSRKKDG
jgi:hypothetical protein